MSQIDRFLQQLDIGRRATIDECKTIAFPCLVVIRILHERNVFGIGKTEQIIAFTVALDIGQVFFRQALHLFGRKNQFCLVVAYIARKFLIDFRQSFQYLFHPVTFVCRKRNTGILIGADDVLPQFPFFVVVHPHDAHVPVKFFILEHVGDETLHVHGTGIGIFPDTGVR